MLDTDRVVDTTVIARIHKGWTKFRELAPFLTSSAVPLEFKGTVYAACVGTSMRIWNLALKAEHTQKLNRTEASMLRWMSGATLRERKSTDELRTMFGLDSITDIITRSRLRWYGHIEKQEAHGLKPFSLSLCCVFKRFYKLPWPLHDLSRSV